MIAYNLCLCLAKRGHEVAIFTASEDRRDHETNYKGINIYQYASAIGYRSESISPGILYKPLYNDVDIIHIHSGISVPMLAGYRCAIKKNKPLVITWHGDSIREYGRYNGAVGRCAAYIYKKHIADKVLSRVNAIITPSAFYVDKSNFLKKYKEKIIEIPNGINLDEFRPFSSKDECKNRIGLGDKTVILFVGGLYQLKGPDILLKAIPKIVEFDKNIIFVFAGRGNSDYYMNISRKLNIERYVKFVGYVTNDKVCYYNSADIFVLPSYEEMFPIVLLEASALGLPLVVSDLRTLRCIVKNNYNGLFVKPGNENELAEAIIYLLDNVDIRNKLGKNAAKLVKDYSWDSICEKTEKLYNSISQNRIIK